MSYHHNPNAVAIRAVRTQEWMPLCAASHPSGVAVPGGVERRIEINEVHSPVREVTPEDVEVVAVIKRAHLKVYG